MKIYGRTPTGKRGKLRVDDVLDIIGGTTDEGKRLNVWADVGTMVVYFSDEDYLALKRWFER